MMFIEWKTKKYHTFPKSNRQS